MAGLQLDRQGFPSDGPAASQPQLVELAIRHKVSSKLVNHLLTKSFRKRAFQVGVAEPAFGSLEDGTGELNVLTRRIYGSMWPCGLEDLLKEGG